MKVIFTSIMIFFLALLILCQVYFYTKNKIKSNDAKGVMIFMNEIMFRSSLLTNLSSLFFFISCASCIALAWVMGEPYENVVSYCVGMLGVVSLFLHCRFFYMKKINSSEPDFLKELFFKGEVSRFTVFIWASRFFYLYFFVMV